MGSCSNEQYILDPSDNTHITSKPKGFKLSALSERIMECILPFMEVNSLINLSMTNAYFQSLVLGALYSKYSLMHHKFPPCTLRSIPHLMKYCAIPKTFNEYRSLFFYSIGSYHYIYIYI